MSIRVHKKLGYGLVDLQVDGPSRIPSDRRWDYTAFQAKWSDVGDERSLQQFLTWCRANKSQLTAIYEAEGWTGPQHFLLTESIKDRIKQKAHWAAPHSSVIWQSEGGNRQVVLFQCPGARDWSRRDDSIDFYEEQAAQVGMQSRVTLIPGTSGIYPYNGPMRRVRDPSPAVQAMLTADSRGRYLLSQMVVRKGVTLLEGPHSVFTGTSSLVEDVARHFREDWRPRVPVGVLSIIEYMGCFPDAFGATGIVNSLRPLIYVYWS